MTLFREQSDRNLDADEAVRAIGHADGAAPRAVTALASVPVLVSAALYAAALPPIDAQPLAAIALAPLFAVIAMGGPARGALLGALWAVAATAGVTWWFPGMLQRFFGLSPISSALGLLALGAVVVAPTMAVFGAALSALARRGRASPLAVAALFSGAELLRSRGPLAGPWALSGVLSSGTPFAQIADLGGPYAAGFVIAAVNAALAGLVVPALRPRGAGRGLAVAGVLAALAGTYGVARIAETPSGERALRVAAVQGGVTTGFAFDATRSAPNLARYLELTREAAAAKPDLVVWPEHAIDFYLRDGSSERAELLATLAALPVEVVLGAPHYSRDGQGDEEFRNSVFSIDRGQIRDRIDKARLVPFAEVSPIGGGFAAGERPYRSGESRRPLRAGVGPLGVLICSEGLFPDAGRELASAGAVLLVHPSNDFWMGSPAAAEIMLRSAAFRAIETRRPLVRATPTGFSAFVDDRGRVVERAPWDTAKVLFGEVTPARVVTPYMRWGDAPLGLAAAAALALALAPARAREDGGR